MYYASPLPHTKWLPHPRFAGSSKQGTYGDVVQEIDWQVGELMNTIEELGLSENTLVIFTSDNGPQLGIPGAGSAGPLRDGKWSNFEGGIRVPCIMRWPKHIPAGSVNNGITGIIDLLPTFCEIAGIDDPDDRTIDGKSILPYMRGEVTERPIHEMFMVPGNTIRYNDWKLLVNDLIPGGPENRWENRIPAKKGALFNLKADPGETKDLSELHPDVVEKLSGMMEIKMKELQKNKREIGKIPGYSQELMIIEKNKK